MTRERALGYSQSSKLDIGASLSGGAPSKNTAEAEKESPPMKKHMYRAVLVQQIDAEALLRSAADGPLTIGCDAVAQKR